MTITPDQILIHVGGNALKLYGTPYRRTRPTIRGGEEVAQTFTRASTGSYIDRDGEIKLAESGLQRIDMVDLDGDGVRETPAFLLEDTRTNVCLRSQEVDNGSWSNEATPTITVNDATAPDGTVTADKIGDGDGVAAEARKQHITIANDSTTWTASVFIKKASAGEPVVALWLRERVGTEQEGMLVVDPILGTSLASAGVANSGVIDYSDDYWRAWLSVTNNSTGNTELRFYLYPAGRTSGDVSVAAVVNAATGSNHFWGAQVENAAFPTSYIATVGSSVARAAETLGFPFNWRPQASADDITVYGRIARPVFASISSKGVSPSVFSISTSTPRMYVQFPDGSTNLQAQIAGTGNSTSATSIPAGDPVDFAVQFEGLATTPTCRLDTGSGFASDGTGAAAFTAFGDTTFRVGSISTDRYYGGIVEIMAVRGLHTLADCRTATQQ